MKPEFFDLVCQAARTAGIEEDLACAIAAVESAWNPWAVRYESRWSYLFQTSVYAANLNITEDTESHLQSCSWGLMQVMGSVARELGFKGPLQQLCAPNIGSQYGCAKIAQLHRRFLLEDDVISAYNAGSVLKDTNGRYFNAEYVSAVNAKLQEFRAIK